MSDVVAAPPPWDLKCRSWTFLVSGLSSASSFPAGFADPNEAEVLSASGEFTGTPGLVMIVSYTETPVGPCIQFNLLVQPDVTSLTIHTDDELIYIPGRWKYKDGTAGYRITRIFVSSRASTENGRRNWNIPKFVADFSITTSGRETIIKVSHLGATEPFFHVKTKPVSVLSSIPIPLNTRILRNYFKIVQPPLPAGKNPEEVGTTRWATTLPMLKGTVYAERIIPQLDGKVGDGKGFPAIVPWSTGTYAPKMTGEFGLSVFADSK